MLHLLKRSGWCYVIAVLLRALSRHYNLVIPDIDFHHVPSADTREKERESDQSLPTSLYIHLKLSVSFSTFFSPYFPLTIVKPVIITGIDHVPVIAPNYPGRFISVGYS